MTLSIIIVNWRSKDHLRACLRTVRATAADLSPQVIVVDGASFDGCGEMLAAEFPEVTFIQSQENLGFGRCNNLGFERSASDVVLFLNPDTELKDNCLQTMLAELERQPDAGILLREGTPARLRAATKRDLRLSVTHAGYADDLVLVGRTVADVQGAFNRLITEGLKAGLAVNASKTKTFQTRAPTAERPLERVLAGDETIENVAKFTSLGSEVASVTQDIRHRVSLAYFALQKMRPLWISEAPLTLKSEIFYSSIASILVYGCESWALTGANLVYYVSAYSKLLRRALNQGPLCGRDALQRLAGIRRHPVAELRSRQVLFLGHQLRVADRTKRAAAKDLFLVWS